MLTHPHSLVGRCRENGGAGGRGRRAGSAVEGHRRHGLRVARQLRQHLAAVQLGQQHALIRAAGQHNADTLSLAVPGIGRRPAALVTVAVATASHVKVRVHCHACDAGGLVGFVWGVGGCNSETLYGLFAHHGSCSSPAFFGLATGRQLCTSGHQVLHHRLLQLTHRLLRGVGLVVVCAHLHCTILSVSRCTIVDSGAGALHLQVSELLPCLVALLHESRNHSAGSVVLVQGLGQLLASGVQVLLEREGLQHHFVPFILECHQQTGDASS